MFCAREGVFRSKLGRAGRTIGGLKMALSDQLAKLAARAKEAEDHAAAAQVKARSDLEQDVASARATGQAEAERLRETADAGKGKISDWWTDVQKTWNESLAQVREDIGSRKAELDRDKAEMKAENAEEDAVFAIDFAYTAIGEAEYAVLDATLARMEADELSGGSGATA
jgi:vacuolar-type H+-ATPase subunit I/STV1